MVSGFEFLHNLRLGRWIAWLKTTLRHPRSAVDGFERGYQEGLREMAYNDGSVDTRQWADIRYMTVNRALDCGLRSSTYTKAYRRGYYRGISDRRIVGNSERRLVDISRDGPPQCAIDICA
jgi:hypothetical protein